MQQPVRKRIGIWGLDTSQQPDALEIGTADTAIEVTAIKNEWKEVYPKMKFQLVMPGHTAPDVNKW